MLLAYISVYTHKLSNSMETLLPDATCCMTYAVETLPKSVPTN